MLTRKDRKLSRVHFEYKLQQSDKRELFAKSQSDFPAHLSPVQQTAVPTLNSSMGFYLLPSAFDRWVSDWTGNVSESAVSPPGNIPWMSHNFQVVHILFLSFALSQISAKFILQRSKHKT